MTEKNVTRVPQCKTWREMIHCSKNTEELIFESKGKVSSYTLHGLGKHLEIGNLSLILRMSVTN